MKVSESMNRDAEKDPQIIDAHQDLVRHIEQSARRMRILAALTVVVAAFLSVSYAAQLALPLMGTTTQTVDLADPALVATELIVLGFALAWLYVGLRDLRFTSRIGSEIASARAKETEIQKKLA